MKVQTLAEVSLLALTQPLTDTLQCSGSSLPTTGQVLATDKRFSTLLLALETAFGNETSLEPPFTVFAPTVKAFNKLDNSSLTSLLQNPDDLAQGGPMTTPTLH